MAYMTSCGNRECDFNREVPRRWAAVLGCGEAATHEVYTMNGQHVGNYCLRHSLSLVGMLNAAERKERKRLEDESAPAKQKEKED